ncbi:uncharacterized protein N7484_003189 [Penicillium longicatenatum]|uniref:uncharacterized protein n=1 Tax=Penicillium longicatenatum TaxID=1561947 RepID=UPI002549501D|nr:uncharacterized protein N7484_003189 [Penicillium longicatenatum]KAJ5649466.1 hypothetical protein N7484_003189 [Penicillium longicatenatum]
MPNDIRQDITLIDKESFPYIFEQNVTIPLRDDFHPQSYSEVNPAHHSEHSAWETPDPAFWTKNGYVVVRADERGTGQSPGKLDTMSRGTSDAFLMLSNGQPISPGLRVKSASLESAITLEANGDGGPKELPHAFLKGEDRSGWSTGDAPKVDLILRKGDVGFNNAEAERAYTRRRESEWPIAQTQYTPFHLSATKTLTHEKPSESYSKLSYRALGTLDNPEVIQFVTPAFEEKTEVTGHIVAHLNVSVTADSHHSTPQDIDIFLTLRYVSPEGKEVFYTGTAGDPVPLCKG